MSSLPSLASQEKEKNSSLMSFVVENRCLVSGAIFVFRIGEVTIGVLFSSFFFFQVRESEEHSDSTSWPVFAVKIHKNQVKNYFLSLLDRSSLLLYTQQNIPFLIGQ